LALLQLVKSAAPKEMTRENDITPQAQNKTGTIYSDLVPAAFLLPKSASKVKEPAQQ